METRITLLPTDEIKFLKSIIITKAYGAYPIQAKIEYFRPMTSGYCMKTTSTTHSDDKQISPILENHPFDEIDDFILTAVRTVYPEAIIRSQLIWYDKQLEVLEVLHRNLIKEKAEILYGPALDNLDILSLEGLSFQCFRLPLDLYVQRLPEPAHFLFKNEVYNINYRINEEQMAIDIVNRFNSTVISL